MRARGVEIAKAILLEHLTEVPLAESNNVVETVAPDAPEKSPANRTHERSLNRRPKNADAGTGRGATEIGTELTVVVSDDELGPTPKGVASRICCAVHCARRSVVATTAASIADWVKGLASAWQNTSSGK